MKNKHKVAATKTRLVNRSNVSLRLGASSSTPALSCRRTSARSNCESLCEVMQEGGTSFAVVVDRADTHSLSCCLDASVRCTNRRPVLFSESLVQAVCALTRIMELLPGSSTVRKKSVPSVLGNRLWTASPPSQRLDRSPVYLSACTSRVEPGTSRGYCRRSGNKCPPCNGLESQTRW